ncbi:MAG: Uma2 family endonuclease [Planctomycetaceae bacterium]|nr:Uma2 family endonuclease [Planctomycetaceae bacterium]
MINTTDRLSADEFLNCRYDLPDAGQWSELERGVLVHFQPPDLDHGTVVLNLSKAFAEYTQSANRGYACFELGLQLEHLPDTVCFPAACYFDGGPLFAESDRQITSSVPALIVELASTADRLRLQPHRAERFLHWGVRTVWTIIPREETVITRQRDQAPQTLFPSECLIGEPVLPGFRIPVSRLFEEPAWWTGKPRPRN